MAYQYAPTKDFRFPPNQEWRSASVEAKLQEVPRPVSVLRAQIPPRSTTTWHSHPRSELLYAMRGLMTVATELTTWVIPEGYGLLIAANVRHRSSCPGALALCAAYIDDERLGGWLPDHCRVVHVSPLLDACLRALAEEPILYPQNASRGDALATLIVEETGRAPETLFPLPMPSDKRLARLCEALFETPALALDIDSWADEIGISRRTLTRRFRTETGLSFAEWRTRLRALRAVAQRAQGTPDAVIAKANGYASAAALRSMIRRACL